MNAHSDMLLDAQFSGRVMLAQEILDLLDSDHIQGISSADALSVALRDHLIPIVEAYDEATLALLRPTVHPRLLKGSITS